MISNSCSGIFGLRFAIKTLLWRFLGLLFIINFLRGFKTKAKERKRGWKEKERVKWLPPRKVVLPCLFLLKALPSYLIWFVFFYWIRRTFQPLSDGIGFMLKTLRNWKGHALASRFYFWIISCNCCISLNMKIYISRSLILLYQNRSDVMLWKNEQYNCIIFRIIWIKTLKKPV